jgi:signal transduction histidine kinase
VLAPSGRDAALTASLLERAGRRAEICADAATLSAEIAKGAGLALLTGEVLSPSAIKLLGEAVNRQAAWSDFPFLVFTSFGTSALGEPLLKTLGPLGNVSLLERPVRVASLMSAVDAALRARRRQYEVRDLVEQLRDGVRQRDQFLAMLGHELRNPLSAMLTAVQILEEIDAVPESGGPLQKPRAVLRRQGEILARLVDDLLEVARVTSGKVSLQRTRLDIASVVQRSLDAVRPQAERQNLVLSFSPGPDPLCVMGDPTRLEQVLLNVLTNAIKYTPESGRIDVMLAREAADIVISVRDNGAGIDPATLPTVFDLFRQADRTLQRAQGGLGIGLTLVRTLVELHGGSVTARSEGLGRGSEFVIRLPEAPMRTDEPRDAPDQRLSEPPAVHRRIFVLEDNADNREGLVFFLRHLGHEVAHDQDGAVGAQRIIESTPELALIDIGLPGIDGYEVARRVRAAQPAVFLVAVTGYGQDEDQRRALAAGFDAHMSKPIDFTRLRRMLASPTALVKQ